MGSVKDLEVIKGPTRDEMGIGRFLFSDRYSVFDWGEMPDRIDGKGAALCLMGAHCFERLEGKGIRTHYRGLVDARGRLVRFDELDRPTNVMEFNLVNVYRPRAYIEGGRLRYDYGMYTPSLRNFLIPLEIIYRNALPEGSSLLKRLEMGLIKLEELGLDRPPRAGERLPRPIFDVSTKLEEGDRYLSWEEAQRISGLTDGELEDIKALLLRIDEEITEIAGRAGLMNEDGKVELAFDPMRRLMVADVVGTLDECRFTYDGLHVSKEVARIFYRGTEWAREVEEAKRRAAAEGMRDWRALVKTEPPRLDPRLRGIMSQMYMAAANDMTGRRMFDVPRLHEVVREYREYRCGWA
jgi:phosphoribosylaminoimidazole-succinocarboxamide synthase